jgi:DNA repair protein RadA/Sms
MSRLLGAGREAEERRVATAFPEMDRVLGGGIVPGSVGLLAGEPGIGKSTLLLQLVAHLSIAGHPCLLASGEESHAQVAGRARRLGVDAGAVSFLPGRDLETVIAAARATRPFLLAVDSIQALRAGDAPGAPGGVQQVRGCADTLAGMAKELGVAVLLTGHVTKEGDVAGPRTLEHAVDVVVTFAGDPASGLRTLVGGKNRFGPEGEVAWFEMRADGLRETDPAPLLRAAGPEPGSATALLLAGRRALAVEVQALVAPREGAGRRQATGLDPRRLSLVAAVLDRGVGLPLGRSDMFAGSLGGVRIADPQADLALAAALASAATGHPAPARSAFVGEIGLTGVVRGSFAMPRRLAAAHAAGCPFVYAPAGTEPIDGVEVLPVRHVREALAWAARPASAARAGPAALSLA